MFSDVIASCINEIEEYMKDNEINEKIYSEKEVKEMLQQMIYVRMLSDSQMSDGKIAHTFEELRKMAQKEANEIYNKKYDNEN